LGFILEPTDLVLSKEQQMRERLELTCPGTSSNYEVLIPTEWQCLYGMTGIVNVGQCPLHISPRKADGNMMTNNGRTMNITLQPGESIPQYYPPEGTVKVIVACDKFCRAVGAIEFEAPES
jgi:hypothetical protein